ncbi:MAG: NAD-dependent epimerase/dehydratase family protein [Bacteroidota bacterium]
MARTAFITGGTGFVGINLIKALLKEDWKLTVLHRPTSNLTYIKDLPIDLVEGSITDKASLETAIPQGTEVVFHVAGDTNMWSKYNDRQTEINVAGTQHMVDVALAKGVKTFIHTSSIAAWGPVSGLTTEETPKRGHTSILNYERTKLKGEEIAKKGMEHGMKVVVINPAAVVGRYDAGTWAQMFFALKNGEVPAVPAGGNNFVHVDDVVNAHILAVDKGQNGHNYILGGENGRQIDLVKEMAQLMGLEKFPSEAPRFLLKVFAQASLLSASIKGVEPTITPEVADFMTRKDYRFSNEKALKELGYSSKDWRYGVKDCYDWLVEEGKL